jgi:short-subunit dehydrogenase
MGRIHELWAILGKYDALSSRRKPVPLSSFILITGALGGLGSALVHECARRGYNLYLTDQMEDVQNFTEKIATQYGVEARYRSCDLTSAEERADLINSFIDEGCRFCGLLNVAGRDYEGGFLDKSRSQILFLVQLIVEASVDLTHAILNLREPERRFLLVFISSLAAFFPMPYKATYASSKRFLLDFSRSLREEIKDFGNVLVLAPAGLPTTQESIDKMQTQGIWGKLTMMDTQKVAQQTIERVLRGESVYVPGFFSRLLTRLGKVLPDRWITQFIAGRWRKSQRDVALLRRDRNCGIVKTKR